MMNSFATAISIALQYGVPLETLVRKFSYMRFEPEGMTSNPEIPFAKSMPDYIMRWLASRFLDVDLQEELGILTPEVRARKAAQDAASSQIGDTSGPRLPTTRPGATTITTTGRRRKRRAPTGPRTEPARAARGSRPPTVALTDSPPVVPAIGRGTRPRAGMPAVRRHDAADGELLHLLELRVQHGLRIVGKCRELFSGPAA